MKISELFEQYTIAFNHLNAEAIAECYSIPCSTMDGDGKQVFSDRPSLVEKFSKNCKAMADMHYQTASYDIVEVKDLGATSKAVNIHWNVRTTHSSMEFGCLYLCSQESNQWQIFSACVYNF